MRCKMRGCSSRSALCAWCAYQKSSASSGAALQTRTVQPCDLSVWAFASRPHPSCHPLPATHPRGRPVEPCLRSLVFARGGLDLENSIDPSVLTMAKCIFFMLLFWHWSGLLWWVIGGEATVDDDFGPPTALANATLLEKYMQVRSCARVCPGTRPLADACPLLGSRARLARPPLVPSQCFYWTVAITSKVREPMPKTRDYPALTTLFSNAVIMFGLLFQALLVGAASSVVQNLDSAAAAYNRQLNKIRSYGRPRADPQRPSERPCRPALTPALTPAL